MAIYRTCCYCGKNFAIHGKFAHTRVAAHDDCKRFEEWMAPLYKQLGWDTYDGPEPDYIHLKDR